MLHWMSRTALECIGRGGLGYSFDTFSKDDMNEYSRAFKNLLLVFSPSRLHLLLIHSQPVAIPLSRIPSIPPLPSEIWHPRFSAFHLRDDAIRSPTDFEECCGYHASHFC